MATKRRFEPDFDEGNLSEDQETHYHDFRSQTSSGLPGKFSVPLESTKRLDASGEGEIWPENPESHEPWAERERAAVGSIDLDDFLTESETPLEQMSATVKIYDERIVRNFSYPAGERSRSLSPNIEDRICFGMLHQVKCRRLPQSKEAFEQKLDANVQEDGTIPLSLRGTGNNYAVVLPSEKVIAHLNQKTAVAIDGLKGLGAEYRAYLDLTKCESQRTKGKLPKNKGSDQLLFINIDIFGTLSVGESVGEFLSSKDTFLQDPFKQTCKYDNPQILKLREQSPDESWFSGTGLDIADSFQASAKSFAVVLDKLNEHHDVSDASSDLLTVQLLRHQTVAQDFMLRRETNALEGERKFWQLDRNEEGSPVYRHIVTGNETFDVPNEPCGGILADDMGLGKTLTTISVVVSSLERAKDFANTARSGYRECHKPHTRATLVVVPSILIMDDWVKEIRRRVKPGLLRVMKYHGHERVRHFEDLQACNVVVTTYGTVTTEYRKRKVRDVLYRVNWFRIVLDEAHTIRSQNTQQFKAITSLEAKHHWCLTGTPIANRVEDLGALLRFMHTPELDDPVCFREHVSKVTRKSYPRGCKVLQRILAPICLRRTKHHLNLPQPNLTQCVVAFTDAEAEAYSALRHHSRSTMDDIVSGRSPRKARHTVLQAILQLRRFCNHGTLMPLTLGREEECMAPDEALTMLQEGDDDFCSSCCSSVSLINQLEDAISGVLLTCGHILCKSCMEENEIKTETEEYRCHGCDRIVRLKHLTPPIQTVITADDFKVAYSSKLNRLLDNLLQTKDSEKSLVFSFWKKTIDLASQLCSAKGVSHVCIDGTTPEDKRRERLEKFKCDPKVSALLMTLGTGALGLNLTAATCVHLLEPQWNPTTEEQAIGRAVRIGQTSRTTVIRYVVKGTVEEQIQGYQKRKTRLAAGGFGESSEAETHEQTKLLTASFLYDDVEC